LDVAGFGAREPNRSFDLSDGLALLLKKEEIGRLENNSAS
jgi:hypothetical protein